MNAVPSIQPPVIPEVGSAVGASAAPISATPGAGKSTFAGALQDAGAKPARKATSSKTTDTDTSGASLPVNGNASPPPPTMLAAVIPIAAGAGDHLAAAAAEGLAAVDAGSGSAKGSPNPAPVSGATAEANDVAAPGMAASPSGAAAAFAKLFVDSAADPVADTQTPLSAAALLANASPAAAGGSNTPTLVNTPTPAVVAAAAGIPTAGSPAGSPTAGSPAALGGKTQRSMLASTPASHAGADVKAASRNAPLAGGDDVDSDTGDSDTPSVSAGSTGPALAAAASSVSSSDPGTMVAVATAGSRPATSTSAGDSGGPSAPIAEVAAVPGAAGSAAVASNVTLAAARAAASAFTLQAAGVTDKHAQNGADTSNANNSADAALGLSQVSSSAVSAPDAASSTPTFRIAANVDSADFSQGIADHVSWMVSNDLNGAKLQVNPAQLGPIELRISVTGDHAQVWMSTHSAVTRDALEASSPKLREMLGAQGFGQVSVDISQRSFQDRSTYAQPYEPPASKSANGASVSSISASATPRASVGVLDAYA
jgi:flagellar hook-length control protein FliK